jgi:hypothetical protein
LKKLALIAVLLATPAHADDLKPAEAPPAVVAPTPTPTPSPAPVPATAPVQAQPTVWVWSDMDAGDLRNLDACAVELPKKVADQWITRLSQHIKPVK